MKMAHGSASGSRSVEPWQARDEACCRCPADSSRGSTPRRTRGRGEAWASNGEARAGRGRVGDLGRRRGRRRRGGRLERRGAGGDEALRAGGSRIEHRHPARRSRDEDPEGTSGHVRGRRSASRRRRPVAADEERALDDHGVPDRPPACPSRRRPASPTRTGAHRPTASLSTRNGDAAGQPSAARATRQRDEGTVDLEQAPAGRIGRRPPRPAWPRAAVIAGHPVAVRHEGAEVGEPAGPGDGDQPRAGRRVARPGWSASAVQIGTPMPGIARCDARAPDLHQAPAVHRA